MILTKEIEIKTTNKNITYYKKYFPNIISGDVIIISVEQLPKTSKQKITVECDVCGKNNEINYFSYLRNINNMNYYSCKKCSKDKRINTNLERYGVEHALQSDKIKKKLKETNNKIYGVDYVFQSDDIKVKIKETNLKRYGDECLMRTDYFKELRKRKMFEIYGVEHALQSDEIKNKLKETNNKLYGVNWVLQSNIVKNKIKKTKDDKYGDVNYNNREKFKRTNMVNFGVDNPMKNDYIKNKNHNTLYTNYGVYHPAQNITIFNKMMKSGLKIKKYKETDIYYQGTYEYDFLEQYYNILDITRCESIKYVYNNKKCIYYPDFYIKSLNLIIEIKSTKWYDTHLEKNKEKEKQCKELGYNFLFIIDKNYGEFEKMISYKRYKEKYCWQYKIRLDNINNDKLILLNNNITDIEMSKLTCSDFKFEYVPSDDKEMCSNIVEFIKKYEWLGKMPNRPTHRFIVTYKGMLGGVVVMSTPNSFSKILGEKTKDIEKLISRGACASWTPKNLASKLIMFGVKWMVKETPFRLFSAYSDTEAKEIGTIYQACNFIHMGQCFGSEKLFFDKNKPHLGWTSGRNFRKKKSYKLYAKALDIKWDMYWETKYGLNWENIPNDIEYKLKKHQKDYVKYNCVVRKTPHKHKYVYILGENKKETKKLKNDFFKLNKIVNKYPKRKD